MRLSIIIPCYNEEKGIPQLARLLATTLKTLRKSHEVELIFVDDGSTDKTAASLRRHFGKQKGFILIQHKKNRNLGAALRTGFGKARGDLVACLDSDCTYEPSFVLTMLAALDEKTDIVTASPYHPKGRVENVPEYRLVLSRTVSMLYRMLTGSRIHTFTSMVRIYRKKVIKNVHFSSDGFLAVTELLVRALQKGYVVKEVPAVLHRRRFGESKIRLASTIRSHLGLLVRLAVGK